MGQLAAGYRRALDAAAAAAAGPRPCRLSRVRRRRRSPQYDGSIDDPALYFNRELSWLDFNQRVLELAEDPEVPLLERLRFCGIYASNLDEFFMVRVAGLFDQLDAGIDARGPDGLTPNEQIDAIQAAGAGARRPPLRLLRRHPAAGAGGAGDPHRHPRHRQRRGAAGDRRPLRAAGLPGADAAGDRPRPALPLHLQPLAQPRRAAARPRERQRDHRPGQGPEGAARPLPAAGRGRPDLRPAGGGDRRQPRRALPRHRGDRPRLLPGHPRRRLHRLRRGRRPPAGGPGRAPPPPLRRGRAARGRRRDEPEAARAAGRARCGSKTARSTTSTG